MEIEPNIFRTYDIRGIYPTELNQKVAYQVGLAYANIFPDLKKIIVAKDVRRSGQELKEGLIQGLIDGGREVLEIVGIVPTPVFSFSICYYQLDGGIMITASHNPKEWNGFKMQITDAYPVMKRDLEKIYQLIRNNQLKKADRTGQAKQIKPVDDYLDYLVNKIELKRPLKIILDCGNGSCNYLPEKIFQRLGCRAETLYGEYDDTFPYHIPDPYLIENLEDLKKKVLKEKADLGLAYDGDGDRVGLVNQRGKVISGDQCLIILARQALKTKKGAVICEVRTSQAFLEDVKRNGGWTHLTVGHHKAVLDKIIETKAVFGGETTGHFYFPLDYYLYDDAIFASLKIAQIVSQIDDFTQYVDNLPGYYTSPEIFINYPDKIKKQAIQKFINILKKKRYKFIDVDGARIIFDGGWAVVRVSNTSPMIKVKFEGQTKKSLIKIEKEVIDLMKEAEINLSKKNYQELGLA